jgi:membrane protease YdiL (CAAX protease family)
MTVRPRLREPLLTFLATTAVAAALYWTAKVVPPLHHNLNAVIAVLFFYAPVVAGRLVGRPFDFREAGLTLAPLRENAATLGLAVAVTLPLFVVGFFAFYGVACAPAAPDGPLGALARLCPGGWLGWAGGHLRWPEGFALIAANQILVVAVPEEVFFRGYLLQRLEAIWPARRRVLGAPVGLAWLLSAVLFALGHVLVDFNPQRLAVFFPALVFGWMRARTGSLAAGAIFHALCNLLADVLHTSFFR